MRNAPGQLSHGIQLLGLGQLLFPLLQAQLNSLGLGDVVTNRKNKTRPTELNDRCRNVGKDLSAVLSQDLMSLTKTAPVATSSANDWVAFVKDPGATVVVKCLPTASASVFPIDTRNARLISRMMPCVSRSAIPS